jgi:hypothetical protein
MNVSPNVSNSVNLEAGRKKRSSRSRRHRMRGGAASPVSPMAALIADLEAGRKKRSKRSKSRSRKHRSRRMHGGAAAETTVAPVAGGALLPLAPAAEVSIEAGRKKRSKRSKSRSRKHRSRRMHGGAETAAAPVAAPAVEGGSVAELEAGRKRSKKSRSRRSRYSKSRYMGGGATETAVAVEGGAVTATIEAGKAGVKGSGCPGSMGWRKSKAKGHKRECVKMGSKKRGSPKYHKTISVKAAKRMSKK